MKAIKTRGETNNFTAPENWDPAKDGECGSLSVRAELYGQRNIIQLVSTWKPNAADLVKLNAGGAVEIALLTPNQMPMVAYVVDAEPSVATPDLTLRDGDASSYTEPGTGKVTDERTVTINEDAHGDDSHGGSEEDQFGYGGRGASGG